MAVVIPVAMLLALTGNSSPSNMNGTKMIPVVKNCSMMNKINGKMVAFSGIVAIPLCLNDFKFAGKL